MPNLPKSNDFVELCSGNHAAALGALLSRPDVVAIYPITPQTAIAEKLSRFHAQGRLAAEIVEVEGENSAMGVISSASVAGARVFTATSSWGLAFMNDGLLFAAARRLPLVMVNVNRETPGLPTIGCGRQDMMGSRDSGWIQIDVETCQEILDTVLMAYRIAEDPDILLPVMVSYDGFYLSHLEERVEIPPQKAVDSFLSPLGNADRPKLSLDKPSAFGGGYSGPSCTEFRYRHLAAIERVKDKIDFVEEAFAEIFGRKYGGALEAYRTGDAEVLLLTMGSSTGAARVVIDRMRDREKRIGLAKLRMLRPFPVEEIKRICAGIRAVGVIDRSVCFGWDCGHLFMELKAALFGVSDPPVLLNFIDGLASTDITSEHIEKAADQTFQASHSGQVDKAIWLSRAS